MSEFNIILGGKIDTQILSDNINKIKPESLPPIKLNITLNTETLEKQLKSLDIKLKERISSVGNATSQSSDVSNLQQSSSSDGGLAKRVISGKQVVDTYKSISSAVDETTKKINNNTTSTIYNFESAEKRGARLEASYDRIANRIKVLSESSQIGSEEARKFTSELNGIKELPIEKQANAFKRLDTQISDSKKTVMSFGEMFGVAFKKFMIWMGATTIFYTAIRALKSALDQVKELDKAMVELNKVSDLTKSQMEEVTKEAFKLGVAVGKTGTEVLGAVAEFKKAGYTLQESFNLAEVALTMSNVADGIDTVAESASYLISIVKGFNKDISFAQTALDAMNEVSNTNAVSFDALADMLQRASAVSNQAGNSFYETIGILTAGYEILQDESKTGTALNSISLRLQGMEEDGEKVDGLLSKLADTYKKYANINITDQNGQLKSSYQIMSELSKVWDNLSKNAKNYIAQESAGVRQANMFIAVLDNFETAQKSILSAASSMGSASEEQQAYLDSIEGKTQQLKSAWQELSDTTINSDMVKWLIDLTTSLTKIVELTGGLVPTILLLAGTFGAIKAASKLKEITSAATTAATAINGAKVATLSFATAISVLTVAISAGIMIYQAIKSAEEERKRVIEESIAVTKEEIATLKELKEEYLSLSSKTDKTEADKLRLKSITDELVKSYGFEQEAIEKLNGAYSEQSEVFNKALYDKAREAIKQSEASKNEAENILKNTESAIMGRETSAEYSWGGKLSQRTSIKGASSDLINKYFNKEFGYLEFKSKSLKDELAFVTEYRDELFNKKNRTKDENTALEQLNARITELNTTIDENQKIISDYEKNENYVKLIDRAGTELSQLESQISSFANSTESEQLKMIDDINASVEGLIEKTKDIAGSEEYIKVITSSFESLRDNIYDSDKALEVLNNELDAYKAQQEALKEEKEWQEKLLEIEKARLELQKAKNKQVRIYREGIGFVWESDMGEVQTAQGKLDKLLDDIEYEKKLKEFETLTDTYNQALLDGSAEAIRLFFLDSDNLAKWEADSYTERIKTLQQFLSDKNKLISQNGSTDFVTETKSPQEQWDSIKGTVGTYVTYGGKSRTREEVQEELAKNGSRMMASYRDNLLKFLETGAPIYHNGGVVGGENFNKNTEVVAKLQKGETVFTKAQTRDISVALNQGSKGGATNISIGNISLPNVKDSDSFIKALENIRTMASEDTNKRT